MNFDPFTSIIFFILLGTIAVGCIVKAIDYVRKIFEPFVK